MTRPIPITGSSSHVAKAYEHAMKAALDPRGRVGRLGQTVTGPEMAAIKSILEMKTAGITAGDRVRVVKDFGGRTMDRDARRTYNDILGGIQPPDPVRPPIVALYSAFINDAVRSGDRARIELAIGLANDALKPHGGARAAAKLSAGGGGGMRATAMSAESTRALAGTGASMANVVAVAQATLAAQAALRNLP